MDAHTTLYRQVKLTMRAIRHVLTERFYTWEDAVELAKTDPEINLAGTGSAYTPGAFLEDDTTSTEASEKAAGQENAAAEGAANRAADPALLEKSSPATEEPVKR